MELGCEKGGAKGGGVGAGVQLLPLQLHPPLGCRLCSLVCGGASAIVAATPASVAHMPALCIVCACLSLHSFVLTHLPSLPPLFVCPCSYPICSLAHLPVCVVPSLTHTSLVSRAGPCHSCLHPLLFILVPLFMCSCLCSVVAH